MCACPLTIVGEVGWFCAVLRAEHGCRHLCHNVEFSPLIAPPTIEEAAPACGVNMATDGDPLWARGRSLYLGLRMRETFFWPAPRRRHLRQFLYWFSRDTGRRFGPFPLKEVVMVEGKGTPPRWAVLFFTIVAIILGAALVYDVVRGEELQLRQLFVAGAFVVCAWRAFDGWRKRRKDADKP